MARLIKEAAAMTDVQKELGIAVDATDMSFGNIVNAISVVQKNMKITGTTALEAGRTISGSVGAMKAAWSNLITGLADGNADIGKLVDNLVTTIVGDGTESNLGVLGNVMPAVKTALSGASRLVSELLPKIVQEIPSIINENLPVLAEAAISIIQSLVDGISENQEMLMTTAFETITYLANSLITMLPQIVALGLDLIVSLANGIADSLPELIPTIIDTILLIVDTLTSPDMLSKILDAALVLIVELAYGLMEAIPELVDAVLDIIDNLVVFLLDPNNIAKILNAALHIVIALGTGLIDAIPRLLGAQATLIKKVVQNFKDTDWGEVGKNIVDGLLGGLKKAWTSLKKWFTNAWDNLVGGVKDLLGIHSPSRVFAGIGKNMALGVGEGWEDTFGDVEDDIEKALDFGGVNYGIATAGSSIGSFGGADAVGGLSIVQNIYSEAKSAAELMREALWQQEKAVYLGV